MAALEVLAMTIFCWIVLFIVNLVLSALAISIIYKVKFSLKKALFVMLIETAMIIVIVSIFSVLFGIAGMMG